MIHFLRKAIFLLLLFPFLSGKAETAETLFDKYGLKFDLSQHEACLVGYDGSKVPSSTEIEISLPSVIDTKNGPYYITKIAPNALSGYGNLTKLILPSSIKSIGAFSFRGCYSLKSVTLPDSITEIPRSLFEGCSMLDNVTIPSNVTNIGICAFMKCSNLTSITLNDKLTRIEQNAFLDCTSLMAINFPASLTNINLAAFKYCRSLKSLSIPKSVISIGDDAFYQCYALKSVEFGDNRSDTGSNSGPQNEVVLGKFAFCDCKSLNYVKLPDNITIIPPGLFHGCSALEEIQLPNSLRQIQGRAFFHGGLKSIVVPQSVTEIGAEAFACNDSLQNVLLNEGLTTIGEHAFSFDHALNDLVLPSSVHSIGDNFMWACSIKNLELKSPVPPQCTKDAFRSMSQYVVNVSPEYYNNYKTVEPWASMTNLYATSAKYDLDNISQTAKLISYESSNPKIFLKDVVYDTATGEQYKVAEIGDSAFKECKSAININLPKDLEVIGAHAFENLSSLASINIPQGVSHIGEDAFRNCKALSSITIPKPVENIEKGTFAGCDNLTYVILPESIKSIGASAFTDCAELNDIKLPSTINTIESAAFKGCESLSKIAIPQGMTEIQDSIFMGCTALTDVELPENIKAIGTNAFTNCKSFSYLNLPDNITHIGKSAFAGCENVVKIQLPASLTEMNDSVFTNCKKLQSIKIPSFISFINNYAFSGCSSLSAVDFSAKLDSIGISAFSGCINLKILDLPDGLSLIKDSAFEGCSSLSEVLLPNQLEQIGTKSFYNTQINKLVIGNNYGFLGIGNEAFAPICPKQIYITTEFVPVISHDTWGSSTGKLFLVDEELKNTYVQKTAPWDDEQPNPWKAFSISNIGLIDNPESLDPDGEVYMEGFSGDTFQLSVKFKSDNCRGTVDLPYITWQSSDPTKATVDNNGLVTVKRRAKAIIEAHARYYPVIYTARFYINDPDAPIDPTQSNQITSDTQSSIDYSKPYQIYTLEGVEKDSILDKEQLPSGVYILRQGDIRVKKYLP